MDNLIFLSCNQFFELTPTEILGYLQPMAVEKSTYLKPLAETGCTFNVKKTSFPGPCIETDFASSGRRRQLERDGRATGAGSGADGAREYDEAADETITGLDGDARGAADRGGPDAGRKL